MTPPKSRGPPKPIWVILQRKIFSRWCAQKLSRRPQVVCKDIVKDIPVVFMDLLEVLSDSKWPGKRPKKPPTMRIQQIEYVSNALKWCWSLGVQLGVKPSAEDLCDAREKPILSLIWAIMLKFIKIGDDDEGEQLNAQEALLMWVQNKTAAYPGVEVKDFKKSFHDGLALCGIIHAHRPKLIDFDSLDPANKLGNIQIAMDAATQYFQLEQYIKPDEVLKLDDKCMMVYVSEYYYGIAEQKKIDLAARRIGKLIALTEENDRLRAEYHAGADKLYDHIKEVEHVLEDRTIDNCMSGAKRRIEEFYNYKTNDKNVIVGEQLNIESLFNNLAMRLAHHQRPEFVPAEGHGLVDLVAAVNHLEACEQERNVALHAELNRQIKLVKLDEQHTALYNKMSEWYIAKKEYVETREEIDSVSSATLQIRLLEAFDAELKNITEKSLVSFKKLGEELLSEKYEKSDVISERLASADSWIAELTAGSGEKKPVLDDALKREEFREGVMLRVQQHADVFSQLQGWVATKSEYVAREETISSINDAKVQLTLLTQFEGELVNMKGSRVEELRGIGNAILEAKYETEYSSWSFESPEDIDDKMNEIDAAFNQSLPEAASAKKATLEAAKALETEKERLRIEFAHLAAEFVRTCKEAIDDVSLYMFGFTLEEVEAYQATMNADDESKSAHVEESLGVAQATSDKMAELGVEENPYTELNMDSLAEEKASLEAAQEARVAAYEEELATQRHNDQLCKDFAEVCEPFAAFINESKAKISTSTEGLEAQLAFVEEKIQDRSEMDEKLEVLKGKWALIEEAGVVHVRHTNLTMKDCEVNADGFYKLLEAKKEMLASEIEHAKLRGITPEQYSEIEQNFAKFDADGSGSIDKKELTACLYSLGEERSNKEIKEILSQHGDGKTIPYDGFKEFMIGVLGDTDTKEEIIDGFVLINKGLEYATEAELKNVMEDHDVDYIRGSAPAKGEGYDYTAWTDDVFSR